MTRTTSLPTVELLSIEDAAREWNVSRDTIERLMRERELDWIRVGSRRRVLRRSMLDYIERQRG